MIGTLRRIVGGVAAAAVLLCPAAGTAAVRENFFAALDAAPVVASGHVAKVERPEGVRLVLVHLHADTVLKGPATVGAALVVVQELVFPSDTPAVAEGARGLAVLRSMPAYSAYRTVLTAGPYYQFTNRQQPLRDAQALAAARRWLALDRLPADERARKRVDALIDYAADAALGQDAIDQLGVTPDLPALLDRSGYDALATGLRNPKVPVAQRRALLQLLAERQVTGALPMLEAIRDPALSAFVHQTIVTLGGAPTVEALAADVTSEAEEQRLAGVGALGTVAARATDAALRRRAIAALARCAADDASVAVRVEAVDRLGAIGSETLPVIETLLSDPQPPVVYAAGRALGTIATPAAVAVLAKQFKGTSYEAQVAAVFGLAAIGTEEALHVLADVKKAPPDPRLSRVIDFAAGGGLCQH